LKQFSRIVIARGLQFPGALRFPFEGIIGKFAAIAIEGHNAHLEAAHFLKINLDPVPAVGAAGFDIFAKQHRSTPHRKEWHNPTSL